ncbi:copper homeostasis protein CutC [Halalkalibaculum sp. DA3122]|uniref:copper homeostasis protein CutC n=1 Tax=Halalkalibaculum sp. DA3122 TaxID=3373607 RepID=UPI003753EBD4
MPVQIEICINADREESVRRSVSAAFQGGAGRIELCGAMHHDGLTPQKKLIDVARKTFRERPGLLVMIRPRKGDFFYTPQTVTEMIAQIEGAARQGADGVVFGALHHTDHTINRSATLRLAEAAKKYDLATTFHRAFDATPNPSESLEQLIEMGIDRVLTSGNPWGEPGSALTGLPKLASMLEQARNRIELVVGGGVSPGNAGTLCRSLQTHGTHFSLHAYSSVRQDERTSQKKVERLVKNASLTSIS